MWSVCLGSVEEFSLCCWLTLVFAWAKIRAFSAFLKTWTLGGKTRDGGAEIEKEKRIKHAWREGDGKNHFLMFSLNFQTSLPVLCLFVDFFSRSMFHMAAVPHCYSGAIQAKCLSQGHLGIFCCHVTAWLGYRNAACCSLPFQVHSLFPVTLSFRSWR